MRFEGKAVIVTGASSGIGRACANLFAMEGAKVVAAARRLDRLEALKAEADYVTVTNDEDGVADAIEKLVLNVEME